MNRYPHPVFGWQAYKLADLSLAQLEDLRLAVVNDEGNQQHGQLHLHTPKARRKLDALAWAVGTKLRAAA